MTAAGYATDPDYADKWLSIYHGDRLDGAMRGLKTEPARADTVSAHCARGVGTRERRIGAQMADMLRIGLSALLAQQRALATTSNNVANASTPGYSRQRVELGGAPGRRLRQTVSRHGRARRAIDRRITDDIVRDQVRTAAGAFNRADAFVGLAQSLDDLLGKRQTGLNATLQSLTNALHDVANDPSSLAARQTC